MKFPKEIQAQINYQQFIIDTAHDEIYKAKKTIDMIKANASPAGTEVRCQYCDHIWNKIGTDDERCPKCKNPWIVRID